jgi:hypothetical protein
MRQPVVVAILSPIKRRFPGGTGMIQRLAAVTAMSWAVGGAGGAAPATGDDYRWDTYTLPGGCTVTKAAWDTWPQISGSWTWTGACRPGEPISGSGVLTLTFPSSGTTTEALSWSGDFEDGYFDGAYDVRELARRAGEAGFSLSARGDTPARYTETYTDGCDVSSQGVDPLCAASRAARTPRGVIEVDSGSTPSIPVDPAHRLPSDDGAGRADNAHNAANEASECLELRTVHDSRVLFNTCPYTVEAVWCVEGHDCEERDPGYTNTWSIQAGNHYTAFGARDGRPVQWAACKGPNSILLIPSDGRWRHRCPDRLQPSR